MPDLVYIMVIFLVVGVVFFYVHMMMGKMIRPSRPEAEKQTIYECGEPTVGSAWIQFDVRYYVVALLFVIFDVEVAFFFPWAVVFGTLNEQARFHEEFAAYENKPFLKKEEDIRKRMETHLPPLPGAQVPLLPREEWHTRERAAYMDATAGSAKSWAWLAFGDILVFFGVLMVGFAYLWRRGDIDWVRSTASEKIAGAGPESLSARPV